MTLAEMLCWFVFGFVSGWWVKKFQVLAMLRRWQEELKRDTP